MPTILIPLYAASYRLFQKALHRLNLHYMPPCYPNGDTLLWCRWCGVREVVDYNSRRAMLQIRESMRRLDREQA